MNKRFAEYAVMAQLVAILLLQWYPLVPHLGRKLSQPQCSGDHRLCGCAPERIAARTCCCYHGKPACCDKEKHADIEHVTRQNGDHSSQNLYAAPCGSSTKFITASLDKLKFVRPEIPSISPVGYFQSFLAARPEMSPCWFREPPDPPPKHTVNV